MALEISVETVQPKANPFLNDVSEFAKHVEKAKVADGERIYATLTVPEGTKDSTAAQLIQAAAREVGKSARLVKDSEPGTVKFWLTTRKPRTTSRDTEADGRA